MRRRPFKRPFVRYGGRAFALRTWLPRVLASSAHAKWDLASRTALLRSWNPECCRPLRVLPMRPLLILVDLQQDYLNCSHLEPMAGLVVQGAANLLAWCREQGMPVAHVWTTVSRIADNRMPHWKQANIWQCVEGTPGHQPPTSLAPIEG